MSGRAVIIAPPPTSGLVWPTESWAEDILLVVGKQVYLYTFIDETHRGTGARREPLRCNK